MKKEKLKPVIILGIYLLIATPVIWFGVSYINSHGIQLPNLEGFDFKTPALYFFSAVAQTMGALLAISFAVLYTQLNTLLSTSKDLKRPIKPLELRSKIAYHKKNYQKKKLRYEDEYNTYIEEIIQKVLPQKPILACLKKDTFLLPSLYFGLTSIFISIVSILLLLVCHEIYGVWFLLLVLWIASAVIAFCIVSIQSMIRFIFERFHLFSNIHKLVKQSTSETDFDTEPINKKIAVDISEIMLYNPDVFFNDFVPGIEFYFINNIFNSFDESQWEEQLLKLADVASNIEETIGTSDKDVVYSIVTKTLVKGCCDCSIMSGLKEDQKDSLFILLSKLLCEYFDNIPGNLRRNIIKNSIITIEGSNNYLFTNIFYGYALNKHYFIREYIYEEAKMFYYNVIKHSLNDIRVSKEYLVKGLFATLIRDITNILFQQDGALIFPQDNQHDIFFNYCLELLMNLLEDNSLRKKLDKELLAKFKMFGQEASAFYVIKTILGLTMGEPLQRFVRPEGSRINNELDQYIDILKSGLEESKRRKTEEIINQNRVLDEFAKKRKENEDQN